MTRIEAKHGRPKASPALERLVIRNGSRIATLAIDDIDWIEAQDCYAEEPVRGGVLVPGDPGETGTQTGRW